MAFCSVFLAVVALFILASWSFSILSILPTSSCYTSIFSFGDSLADTGNSLLSGSISAARVARLPYGQTFFHHPTGRCSDGRLIVDFIAEAYNLPLLPPYLARKEAGNYTGGVNFAVFGATALDPSVFVPEKMISAGFTNNYSLSVQVDWFRKVVPTLCSSGSPDCFRRSLFLVGEIGGNDFNEPLLKGGMALDQVKPYVPVVVASIADAVTKLVELGAVELVVPGNLPIGCNTAYLTVFRSQNQSEYDPETGCLKRYNEFVLNYNSCLQHALERLKKKHPHATISYADYYNAFMRFITTPSLFGFQNTLKACCGAAGEPYHFNSATLCGNNGSEGCKDPNMYVNWDGLHLTERAYQWMAHSISCSFINPPLRCGRSHPLTELFTSTFSSFSQ